MKSPRLLDCVTALILMMSASWAQASTVSGTVTNKTTGKPAAGDAVLLIEAQSGMREAARTTTDLQGRYTLSLPGSTPYLIRANHHGVGYFIAAPSGNKAGNITVYDSAGNVENVAISADVYECETANGKLYVNERYFVHNFSSPARTQYSATGFKIVLPAEAVLDSAAATRPGGLATNINLKPASQKGHYYIDFPLQPTQGDEETLFDVRYHVPYNDGKYTFTATEPMPAVNVAVLLPTTMSFKAGSGAAFTQIQEDPSVLTFIAKNAPAGKAVVFTVSGTGEMPRENQGTNGQQTSGQDSTSSSGQAGGGIGTPINTPDPLSKYKWWILSVSLLILAMVAALLLRKPAASPVADSAIKTTNVGPLPVATPANRGDVLLSVLKEEMFALESEKVNGAITAEEYAEAKAALETVLKRALKRKS
jgi:hypothetical protein